MSVQPDTFGLAVSMIMVFPSFSKGFRVQISLSSNVKNDKLI